MTKKIAICISLIISSCTFTTRTMEQTPSTEAQTILDFTTAALNGDKTKVEEFFKAGIDVNSKGPDGKTALSKASGKGHVEIVEFLLSKGAIAQVVDFTNAAYTNKPLVLKAYVKSGFDINSKGPGGQTALQRAASQGHVEVVDFLLENGANPLIADGQKISPLIAAVMSYPSYKNLEALQAILKMLIAKGADINAVNAGGQTALMLAIATELFPVAEILLNEGATIWPKNIYHQAASDLIDEQTMRRLEQKLAAAQTDEERESVKHEIDIMVRIKGNETKVKQFLTAASANDQTKIEQLLQQGILITSNDAQGDTALHYAAMQGHKDMVAFLLEKGADIEQKDLLGMTPLHVAARSGQFKMVEFLLQRGANPSTLDKQNYNPLITAIKGYSKHKNLEALTNIVEILLAKGDNINQQNKDGQTALIYASILDLENIVQMLVDVGADTTLQDQLHHNALEVTKNDNIKQILKSTNSENQKRKAEAHKEVLAYVQQADIYEAQKQEEKRLQAEEEKRLEDLRQKELQRQREEEEKRQQELQRIEQEARLKQLEEQRQEEELRRRREFEEQQQADLLRLQADQQRELELEEERQRQQGLPQALTQLGQALRGLQRTIPRRTIPDDFGLVKKHQ